MYRRFFHFSLISSSLLASSCVHTAFGMVQTNSDAEREIMRNAQLWQSQYRTDLARQQVNKLLLIEPNSAWGIATLASIALQEDKKAEAQQLLQKLQSQNTNPQAIAQLQALLKLYTPQAQQELTQMRLFTQSGRTAEATALARKLFPEGPLALGNFQLDYYRALATAPGPNPKLDAALQEEYARTQNVQYKYLWIQRQLEAAPPSGTLLREIERLAVAAPSGDHTAKDLWRWALHKLPWEAVPETAQAFLNRFPQDESMQAYLAESRRQRAQAERIEQSPLNVAKRKGNQALDNLRLDEAQAQAQKILSIQPNDAEGWGLLGYIASRKTQYAAAQEAFEKAYHFDKAPHWKRLANTAHINSLLQQADAAVSRQDTVVMRAIAQQILAIDSHHAQAMTLQAQALNLEGKYQLAQDTYQAALKQVPIYLPALNQLVQMLIKQQQWDAASQVLKEYAAQLPPTDSDANALQAEIRQGQAQLLLAQNKQAPALRLLEQALQLTPQNPWLRHQLARLYLAMNEPALANSTMDDGITLTPDANEMRYARALIRAAQDQWTEAASDLTHIPETQRSSSMQQLLSEMQLNTLIQQAITAENTEKQEAALERAWALSIQVQDVQTQAQLANIWQRAGYNDQALAMWKHIEGRQHPLPLAMQLAYAQALSAAPQENPALMPLLHSLKEQQDALSQPQQQELLDLYARQAEQRIATLLSDGHPIQAANLARDTFLPHVDQGHTLAVRGRLLAAAQDWSAALPLLQSALEKQPHDFVLTLDTANAYARTGQLTSATALAQHAEATAMRQPPWQQLALVRLWQRLDQPQKAQNLLAQLQSDPEADPNEVLLHQGRLALNQRQYQQASEAFSTVAHSPALQRAPANQQAGVWEEYQAVEARRQSWVEIAAQRLSKSGTAGISALKGWEIPMVAWKASPELDGHHFLHVDRLALDAGTLSTSDIQSQDYGQIGAATASGLLPNAYQGPMHSKTNGFNAGLGFQGDRYDWDIGLTGLGMPVTNVVGGARFEIAKTPTTDWRLTLGRRPITGSLLSYSGAKDPVTGAVWGGVVHTFAALRATQQQGAWDQTADLSLGVITGKNVAHNTRTRLRLSTGKDMWRAAKQRIYAGVTLQYLAHNKNLAEYSWGHGGYYSPKSSVTLSLPIEWTGRAQAWTWRLQGSASVSHTSSSRSDLYPGAAHPLALSNQSGYYSSNGGSGTSWALQAAIERQLNNNVAIGAKLGIDRSENFAPNQFQIYLRYALNPVRRLLENQPRQVTPYSEF